VAIVHRICGLNHDSVARRYDGRGGGSAIIRAEMGFPRFLYRVETPHGESGSDPAELERRFQKSLAQAFPGFVKIIHGLQGVRLEPEGVKSIPLVAEHGRPDLS